MYIHTVCIYNYANLYTYVGTDNYVHTHINTCVLMYAYKN